MTAGYNPTVRRRRLGVELRRLRELAKMTGEEAAERMSWSGSKVSRIERGQVASNSDDVRDLLELYGVDDPALCGTLILLARESRRRGWWHVYGDVIPERFEVYLGLEPEASALSFYQTQVVPGLLQTGDYARALLGAHPGVSGVGDIDGFDGPDDAGGSRRAKRPPGDSGDIDRRAGLRTRRQALLTREHPPEVCVVLDESVLWRPVGTPQVMAEQIRHLVDSSRKPRITLQVLPFETGAHSGLNGSFDILEFAESDIYSPRLIHLENLTSSLFIEKGKEVSFYTETFEHLRAAALQPAETRDLLAHVERHMRDRDGG